MESGLEVVGRHAMLFDDDAALTFTNSKEALIEWNNSLFIDRFDVRNLITNPPPSFRNLPSYFHSSSLLPDDSHLQSDLDVQRYADLPSSPSSSPNHQLDIGNEAEPKDSGGYRFVPFTYGNSADSSDQKSSDMGLNSSVFYPPFPVPQNLIQNLPPTEKVHQIMARTAIFVVEHGGQTEIVLRVKQGDNPTFGFLMPHHQLHPYFRYLVEHPEVLKADKDLEPPEQKHNDSPAGGALSLLGSVYGSGEDEDVIADVDREPWRTNSGGTSSTAELSKSSQPEQTVTSGNVAQKEGKSTVLPQALKMKVTASSKLVGMNKDRDVLSSTGSIMERPKAPSLFPLPKVERSLVDPTPEVKRLIDRVVEIIMKNGKDFVAVLIEQDKKVGKFPFLLPSSQYHAYYLKVLRKAHESRINVKSFNTGKDGLSCQEEDKETAHSVTENDVGALGSGTDDLLLDDDKKEKFKMVIGKSRKDSQDQSSKEPQRQSGFTVDTAAAAAILQAATKGVRKPNLNIFSKTSHASGYGDGRSSGPTSLQSSQQQSLALKENGESSHTNSIDKDIAEIASRATAGGPGSSEARLTREQKLKADRLRRAKMFAAMIKSGVAPLGTEPVRALSVEPPGSENSGSALEAVNEKVKEREGNSDPPEPEISNKLKSLKDLSDDENEQKLRTRRHYRSRNHDDKRAEEENEEKREDDVEDEGNRHSRRRHRSHRSSRHHRDRSKDRHKHRRRRSTSKTKESRHRRKCESSSSLEDDTNRHKHDSSSEEEHKRLKHHRHKHDSSSEEEHKRKKHHRHNHDSSSEEEHKRKKHHRHQHDSSSEEEHKRRKHHRHQYSSSEEHKHLKRSHRYDSSPEDEHRRQKRRHRHSPKEEKRRGKSKNDGTSDAVEVELEEGEIITRSPQQSLSAMGNDASREASVSKSPTEVPEDLRAKIRAMLLSTM